MPERPFAGRVGFIGLGRMGAPMAARLAAAGIAVTGYDTAPGVSVPGVEVAPTVAEATRDAAVVILMLPSSDVVDAVLIDGSVLDQLAAGTVVIDMGSSEPLRTRSIAERAGQRSVRFVDAPVSGGVTGAVAGSLTIMAGGDPNDIDAVEPILRELGARVVRCGGHGAGHAVKALNNLMSAAHLLVTSEAMLAAQAFGLEPSVVLDAVNTSSGRSGSTENKWPNFVVTERYDSGFALDLMVKDMRIAVELAGAMGAPTGLSDAAYRYWQQAGASLGRGRDHTEIVRWLAADGEAEMAEPNA